MWRRSVSNQSQNEDHIMELDVRQDWAGFDLLRVGGEKLVLCREENLVVLSGCITTTSPMKQKSDFDITIGEVPPGLTPKRYVSFLSPTGMSRYEGIRQCSTSTTLRPDGRIVINFNKSLNPMVMHFCGVAFSIGEPKHFIQVVQPDKGKAEMRLQKLARLLPMLADPPCALVDGGIVSLQGQLAEATFGFSSQTLGILPEGCRPRREIRCITPLLRRSKEDDGQCDIADQSIALTVKTDGKITIYGGNVHVVDQKGHMRVLPQKKRGILSLDGIRFYIGNDTAPVEIFHHLQKSDEHSITDQKKKELLQIFAPRTRNNPTACRQGNVVLLEGTLDWTSSRPFNPKMAVAQLPAGFWPRRRVTFFTRGRQEERRRVDVDIFGRIFCPEGADKGADGGGGYVDLSGVIFIRATTEPTKKPLDVEFDELRLQYNRTRVSVGSSSFKGHELLEKFIRRCNVHEWRLLHTMLTQQSGRRMMTPGVGRSSDQEIPTRGWERGNEWNLGKREGRLWRDVFRTPVYEHYGISTFHTLLHLSDRMLDEVLSCVKGYHEEKRQLKGLKKARQGQWDRTRQPHLTFKRLQSLGCEISDQMFEHWDFHAQMQGLLKNDFRAPKTIEHLFPRHVNRWQDKLIKENVSESDMQKFEEIRQFFFLYETTGSNMTHCSLMGSQDLFTTTGKWHFPDADDVQNQLFENIAWLFDKNIYHYISERQTPRFPFIEDFDIQAACDWKELLPGQLRADPPDELIMTKPQVDACGNVFGDPGDMMKYRAQAIHMIYPQIQTLYCLVYSASGFNKGKELLKSSFHLVWPQLVVDPDRAPVIRYVTLGIFKNETNKEGSKLNQLQKQLMDLHESNEWELVFDSTTINARNGLRLPYSDKASMVVKDPEDREKIKRGELSKNSAFKVRVTEERPSKAVGRIDFRFEKGLDGYDSLVHAQWVANESTYPRSEWIRMGSCRRDQSSVTTMDLTQWQLGPDVMAMLPKKPGEKYYRESEDDSGTFSTHVPYTNIMKCTLTAAEFMATWDEQLAEELNALDEEMNYELQRRIAGSWISVTETQALWRTPPEYQFADKFPDWDWGVRNGKPKLHRPAELIYLVKRGKVVLDGPEDLLFPLIRVLKNCRTDSDDHPIMPVFDTNKMEHFPSEPFGPRP